MSILEQQITTVAIYLRVSSDDQRQRGTIESQRTTLVEYAEREGWEYVIYEDDGISGATIANRPGMKSLLAPPLMRRSSLLGTSRQYPEKLITAIGPPDPTR